MATTGQSKCTASSFGRNSLLDSLREECRKLCDGEESSARDISRESEDYDPMADVEQVVAEVHSPGKTRGRGQKRVRYYKNHASNTVVTLNVPVRCPGQHPNCTELRRIRLYITDRRSFWLDLADVEWAVRYLYIQNLLNGCPADSNGFDRPCHRFLNPW